MWLNTLSGNRFDPENPQKFLLKDTVWALSLLCRFSGNIKELYSVLQHSVIVSEVTESLGGTLDEQMFSLCHDFTESVCNDIITPIKRLFPEIKIFENKIQTAMQKSLKIPGYSGNEPSIVKYADQLTFATETVSFFPKHFKWELPEGVRPLKFKIKALSPKESRALFYKRYNLLLKRMKAWDKKGKEQA